MATAELPTRISYAEADQSILLGLYYGYDQARISLARLVARFGTGAASDEATRDDIWARTRRSGVSPEIFDPTPLPSAAGLNQGAHSAALTAFATLSEQAEELLRALRARWPELCEDAGGPLPVPAPSFDLEVPLCGDRGLAL